MKEIITRTVVIGSGCAGLNAADWLFDLGEKDVLLVTEGMNCGTSRNTGSDKQTYYKLSLSGDDGDSVGDMMQTFLREDVHGDTALCEAANSAKCFFKLALLGVPFPFNEYGEYVGYQTDHDVRKRATSVGPLTSKFMTEALQASVERKGVRVLDHALAYEICTDENGVCGVNCFMTDTREWVHIRCAHVVLCTGGPAHIYRDSVFPLSQHGMSAMAFMAGAKGANLDCWQYGLASTLFRWNVSGSYQQVIPRYVSVDENGTEREFLADALGEEEAMAMTFLKGYQWPYDVRKTEGSSRVDILVKKETDLGRKVYMDFMHNPRGYAPERLSGTALEYLTNCHALQETPIERLRAMNAPAIELYRAHNIDIEREMLEVRVCAQHHNGGIAVDSDWQTCVPGLYACGECAGTFGMYRPGGSALNSTQVGSMRAAEHIARASKRQIPVSAQPFAAPLLPCGDVPAMTAHAQAQMTLHAAFLRNSEGMRTWQGEIKAMLQNSAPAEESDEFLVRRLRLRDLLITQQYVLSAMLAAQDAPSGGVMITDNAGSRRETPRPLPERDLWFERVWKKSRNA